ncbi:amidohydrolase [Oceanobacillus alkalisoli]|uniref:amidohydrolase n=1 Tax=Oceanobacillus alkalisoli TaxID=2925113 RepID=UPI001EF12F04|nr:amidohydrolase [Oceanobacillus alkalisoli]MCF3943712.1 amidohydrolase [Oceanobacillus alkalisoli]MCG5104123.1 amidohydrolase [Oceanobacillus alkalisoli]
MIQSDLQEYLISIRRYLHQYPELSLQEFETTKFIQKQLQDTGIHVRKTSLKTGVFAQLQGKSPGPTIALRADIDALPIEEQTGLSYASKVKGVMHACGHDFHTAALIGAAYLLKKNQNKLKGNIRFIFQPAEEIGGGAEQVIDDGQLEGVEAIIGLHNKPELPVGTIGLKAGPVMASVDRFRITVKGKGSHAAIPQNGKDPILASSQMVTALHSIVSRNISPLESAVVSVTRITGGTTWNVIPGEVTLEGTTRTFNDRIREEIKGSVQTIVENTVRAYSGEAIIDWFPGPPPVINDTETIETIYQAAQQQGLNTVDPEPTMGGEDFAFYQQQIPGAFVFFGTNGNEDWHHPAFTIDESSLIKASYFLYESALSLLQGFQLKQDKKRELNNEPEWK